MKDNPDIVVLEYQELSNFFLSVNMGANGLGFNDLRVRQAISHAIDREAIVKSIFLGHAVATYGPVMTKYKWYNPAVEKYNQFNLGLAEHLLDEAGWKKARAGSVPRTGSPCRSRLTTSPTRPRTRSCRRSARCLPTRASRCRS